MPTRAQLDDFTRMRRLGMTAVEAASATIDLSNTVDLAHSQAWRTERRGHGGQWTSGGGDDVMIRRTMQRQRRNQQRGPSSEDVRAHEKQIADLLEQHRLKAVAEATATARSEREQEHKAHEAEAAQKLHETRMQVRNANLHLKEVAAKEEQKTARRKIAWHAGIISSGAVLAAVEAKMGTPGIVQLITAIGPQMTQEIIDFAKKLG